MPTESELLRIKRELKARAKKLHLGKARTGAYVYGTLRKIRGNPEGVRPIQGGGTMYTREGGGVDRFRLMAIKQGLKARKIGMFVTRGATTKKLLGMLSEYTGEKYGSRDLDRGIADADKLLASDVNMETQRQIARGLVANPVARAKTWKLGEYGGNIKAKVNQSGTAVQILHSDSEIKEGAYGRLFRWPLDKFELEMHLTNFTTSYYAGKIIEWVEMVTKGTAGNPPLKMTAYEVLIRHPRMKKFLGAYPMELPDSIYLDNAISHIERLMKEKKRITPKMIDSEVESVILDAQNQYGVQSNPPLYAHHLVERRTRNWWGKQVTHGLNVAELRALHRLVKRGHREATMFARRKLEIPPSETKSQILAIIDHHIRDLMGK
ncbi:hypothetical protein EBZ80_07100 [bacterium]|nr:hypothetical protein [bacterium]